MSAFAAATNVYTPVFNPLHLFIDVLVYLFTCAFICSFMLLFILFSYLSLIHLCITFFTIPEMYPLIASIYLYIPTSLFIGLFTLYIYLSSINSWIYFYCHFILFPSVRSFIVYLRMLFKCWIIDYCLHLISIIDACTFMIKKLKVLICYPFLCHCRRHRWGN